MFLEWSRELLQKSNMGKHLPIPTSSSARQDKKMGLRYPVRFSASGMNVEVEGKNQSFFFFFFKKKSIKVSPSFSFYKCRIHHALNWVPWNGNRLKN